MIYGSDAEDAPSVLIHDLDMLMRVNEAFRDETSEGGPSEMDTLEKEEEHLELDDIRKAAMHLITTLV